MRDITLRSVAFSLLGVLLGIPMTGCQSSTPHHWIILCDGTGDSPEVCTTEFLQEAFLAWTEHYLMVPGSRFTVLTSAGEYGEIVAHDALIAPNRWKNLKSEKVPWIQEHVTTLAHIAIPIDTPDTVRQNKSNLFAGVHLGSQVAAETPNAMTTFILASDGWAIGLGFNFEQSIPSSAADVVTSLRSQAVTWNLAAFSEVQICGFDSRGVSTDRDAARRQVWPELLVLGGVKQRPLPARSCHHFFTVNTVNGLAQTDVTRPPNTP